MHLQRLLPPWPGLAGHSLSDATSEAQKHMSDEHVGPSETRQWPLSLSCTTGPSLESREMRVGRKLASVRREVSLTTSAPPGTPPPPRLKAPLHCPPSAARTCSSTLHPSWSSSDTSLRGPNPSCLILTNVPGRDLGEIKLDSLVFIARKLGVWRVEGWLVPGKEMGWVTHTYTHTGTQAGCCPNW